MQEHSPVEQLRVRRRGRAIDPQPGDLLFGNRFCSVQMLMNLAGEQWTHIAVVTEGDGDELRTVELGPNGMMSRTAEEFMGRYRLVGLARPELCAPCRQAVLARAAVHLGMDGLGYSWPYCFIIGSTGFLRRFAPGPTEDRVIRTGLRAADRVRSRSSDQMATCSSFIADLLDSACATCRPTISWPSRRRVPPWQPRPTPTDVVGLDGPPVKGPAFDKSARALVAPADVWVADGYALRAVITEGRTTILRDLQPHAALDPQTGKEVTS